MVIKVELRVHAGAPSSRKDDDRYQAQAEAYLGFRGVVIPDAGLSHGGESIAAFKQGHDPSDQAAACRIPDDSTMALRYDATTFVEDTQLAHTALESQLQSSSIVLSDRVPSAWDLNSSPWPGLLERGSQQYSSPLAGRSEDHVSREALPVPKLPRANETLPPARNGESVLQHEAFFQRDGTSQSSYLVSPVLHRSAKVTEPQSVDYGARRSTRTASATSPQEGSWTSESLVRSHGHSRRRHSLTTDQPNKKPRLDQADYREHTPKRQSKFPYVPLPEGRQMGTALVEDRNLDAVLQRSQTPSAGHDTTSELPTVYSLSDITSESSRTGPRESPGSRNSPGLLANSHEPLVHIIEVVASTRVEIVDPVATPISVGEQRSRKHVNERRPLIESPAKEPGKYTNDPLSISGPVRYNVRGHLPTHSVSTGSRMNLPARFTETPGNVLLDGIDTLPMIIRPPQPSVAIEKLTTHITQDLHWLTENVGAAFEPLSMSRELRPNERGHWLIDPSSWRVPVQVDFWRFLDQMIGKGNAGWGVWCLREQQARGSTDDSRPIMGVVKVYCWGEIVKHIYLLLYVASKSKVRRSGVQWIDADEGVVVRMRSS